MADIDIGSLIGNLLAGGTDIARAFGGGSTGDIGRAREAAALADPFASQRGGYQEMLKKLLTTPGSFEMDPGTIFARDQALDAAKGSANALYGSSRVGALLPELEKIGAGYANQGFNSRIAQLLTASGATTGAPGAAAATLAGGFDKQDGSIAAAIRNLVGGGANVPGQVGSGVLGMLGKLIGGSGSSAGFQVDPITGKIAGEADWSNFVTGSENIFDRIGGDDWSGFDLGGWDRIGGDDWSNFDWNSLLGDGGGFTDALLGTL